MMLRVAVPIAAFLAVSLAVVTREMREREFFRQLEVINVDSILINQRLIDRYIKCLLKTGKCDPTMKDLRIALPLILGHLCESRCSERETRNLRKLFVHIRTNRPLEWERLSKLYDPKGTYKADVDAFIDMKPRPARTTATLTTSTTSTAAVATDSSTPTTSSTTASSSVTVKPQVLGVRATRNAMYIARRRFAMYATTTTRSRTEKRN